MKYMYPRMLLVQYGVSIDVATSLLCHAKWNLEELDDRMRADANAVFAACGLPLAATPAPSYTAGDGCAICYGDMEAPPDSFALSCGHWFCRPCWAAFCESKVVA